jgi:hypothetical protein
MTTAATDETSTRTNALSVSTRSSIPHGGGQLPIA